ncbi:MAG: M13 family metallopeptidase [Alphaproteobacteria bacterium]|nr:M13 family metallopeptidase [Alphaproteobacteria bacterium]
MKSKVLIIVCVAAALLAGGGVYMRGQKLSTGIDLKNMDLNVRPGDDFYDFATAGWRAKNPIPDDFSAYGVFHKLDRENNEKIKALILNIAKGRHAAGTNGQKIATFYNVAMDEKKLNADGIAPIAEDMAKISATKSRDELPKLLGELHKFINPFWGDSVYPDVLDSETDIYNIGRSGIGLPERDYYFDKDSFEIRKKYLDHLEKLFAHFKIDADVMAVYGIEEQLAKVFYTKEMRRIPEKNYHKFTYAEFKKEFPGFDWDAYFAARGVKPTYMNVSQPSALAEALKILADAPLEDIKNYIKRMLVLSASPYLDDEAHEISFDFYSRTIAGQVSPRPRWERALAVMDGSIGEAVGEAYVKKYFPPEAKERMEKLVENLRAAYAEHIRSAEWMSEDTKKEALEKLGTFSAKIGYPEKFRDYSGLEIKGDSYWANVKRARIFEDKFWLDKIETKVDRSLWFIMPQTINAYYWSQANEIVFPAGILQPPFFDMSADDAANYGAIGVIIAHEMTHGFDDRGRKFDAQGNLRDWWTEADAKAFKERAEVMRRHFDKIEILPGVFANGEFSLGETLADLGGATLAFTAFKNATADQDLRVRDGFTPEQRFFIAFGAIWAENSRDEEILRRLKITPHPPGRWRVNGILPHVDAWYDAFGAQEGDKLYIAPEDRVKVW